MNRSESESDEIDAIKSIQRAAYLLIFSIGGITLVVKRDEITQMWSLQGGDPLRAVLQVALFICAISVVIRWIAATAHEFQLWLRNLHYVFIRSQVYMAMLGLAVVLGMMLILVYNIVAFTAFFSCYLFFNYWTQWVANEHFERAVAHTTPTDASHEAVLRVLRRYWLQRPQLARIVTMLFASMFAFSLAIAESRGGQSARLLGASAYVLTILNIILGEAVISRWRAVRDRELQALMDQTEGRPNSDLSLGGA